MKKNLMKSVLAATLTMTTLALSACGTAQAAESSSEVQQTEATAESEQEEGTASAGNEDIDVQTIKVGLNVGLRPNSYLDDNGDLVGYEVDVLKAIDDKLPQYAFEFENTEFASLFVSLDAGNISIASGNLRRSDAREEGYIHTYRAYNYTPYRIYVLEEDNSINGIEDLDGKKVGIGLGSLQATILEHYIEETGASIELIYSTDVVNDLVAGNIDAFINPDFAITSYNEQFENVKFKQVGEAIESKEGNGSDSNAYFYFAQGSEELRDAVSEAIYELREEGTLSELCLQYYPVDYASKIDTAKEEEQIETLGK